MVSCIHQEGVMHMRAKERVLMLRLMEKLQKHPDFAARLGVETNGVAKHPNTKNEPQGLTDG